jgi:hypothetical protein
MLGGRTASLKLRGTAERDLREAVDEASGASFFDIVEGKTLKVLGIGCKNRSCEVTLQIVKTT